MGFNTLSVPMDYKKMLTEIIILFLITVLSGGLLIYKIVDYISHIKPRVYF